MWVHGRSIDGGKDQQGDLLYKGRKYSIIRQKPRFFANSRYPPYNNR